MISPLPSTLAYYFCFALCSHSCLCIFPPSRPSCVPLLVPFSHCVEPVGRLFPLERGLGSVYPITEYDSFLPPSILPSPSVCDSSPQTSRRFAVSVVSPLRGWLSDLFALSICSYAKEPMLDFGSCLKIENVRSFGVRGPVSQLDTGIPIGPRGLENEWKNQVHPNPNTLH